MRRLVSHLARARTLLHSSSTLRICLGNTSADFDSCVGSVLLSHFLTGAQEGRGVPFVPVVNGNLSKLRSCKALARHFETCKIPISSLIFYDDLANIIKAKPNNKLELILFDHNELDPTQEHLGPSVSAIYDHHVDIGKYPLAQRNITPCASATSLLLSQPFCAASHVDFELARFAVGPILMDTRNFAPKLFNTRWNSIDKHVYDLLHGVLAPEGFDPNAYYNELESIENNVSESLKQGPSILLAKDYKNYKTKDAEGRDLVFGAASLNVGLKEFLQHFGPFDLLEQFKALSNANGLKYLIVLGRASETQRDFLLFTEDSDYLERWNREFEQYRSVVGLQNANEFSNTPQCFCYTYKNLELTRKKLEPLWREVSKSLR